jgi:signal transduction histidine kinase
MSSASLDPVDELVDGLIATGRRIVSELHAPVLEGLGLAESVRLRAAEFIRHTRIHCDVTCAPADLRLDDRTTLLLYRIVQESLTNVARHSAATTVTIAIRAGGDDLVLLVEDNGRGIAATGSAGGRFGVIGMRERALALGGRFAIRGGIHGGTVVEVVVPFGAHNAVEGGA